MISMRQIQGIAGMTGGDVAAVRAFAESKGIAVYEDRPDLKDGSALYDQALRAMLGRDSATMTTITGRGIDDAHYAKMQAKGYEVRIVRSRK